MGWGRRGHLEATEPVRWEEVRGETRVVGVSDPRLDVGSRCLEALCLGGSLYFCECGGQPALNSRL